MLARSIGIIDPTSYSESHRDSVQSAFKHQCSVHLAFAYGTCALDLIAEAFEIGATQLVMFNLGRSERIDRFAVGENFEVQVRTGRVAGAADKADQLVSAYLDAFLDAGRELGKVTIDRGKIPRMIDADLVAVSGIRRRADNDAVGRGVYRRAGRCREIDALMHE
jgi:hypothetical protein